MEPLTPQQVNVLFPVIGAILFQGGVIVRRGNNCDYANRGNFQKRGNVVMVNKRSLNKLALLVRSAGVEFLSVMTLTYGQNYPLSGRKAKKDLNNFLTQSKRVFGSYEYIWVLEFQSRGAVHYHLATTLKPPTDFERSEFASLWTRVSVVADLPYCEWSQLNNAKNPGKELSTYRACYVQHNHPKAWEALQKRDGVSRYFAKYANKLYQKNVPAYYSDVGRFWGASRGVKLPDGEYLYGTDDQLRQLAAAHGRHIDHWRVLPKIILLG